MTLEEFFQKVGLSDKIPSLVMRKLPPTLVPVQVAHAVMSEEGKAGLRALEEAFKKALADRAATSSVG